MQLGRNKFTIVGTRDSWILLTEPKTYQQYACRWIPLRTEQRIAAYQQLANSNHQSLLKILQHKSPSTSTLLVITKYFESTINELLVRAGTFKNQELLNTLEQILLLLHRMHQDGLEYGMLSPSTICFCNGEIKLGLGPELQRAEHQESVEADLLSLGKVFLQLSVGPKASQTSYKRLQIKYSKRLCELIKTLNHRTPQKRLLAFQALNCNANPNPQEPIEIPKAALVQSVNVKETQYSFQVFQSKIRKIDDLVEESLKKSKRLMSRGENIGSKTKLTY